MAFCPKCGAQLEENAKFCASCGEKLSASTASDAVNDAFESVKNLNNTPDTTASFDAKDIEDNKILSLFAYLGILFLIPLLAAPNSKFARFHANQGLVLFLAGIVIGIVAVIPILGWIVAGVGGIFTFVLMILGIVNAVSGKAKELPLIGKINILK